ncbi:ethanolamine ammonia-lyase subunit EutC [Cupriavidus consociatus]|uniref:ethanolamine ammonia-lyase subunit EutC n=1 Tax=Cupriavidus consociatus TaxID=2821357 RepID=UPI001AE74782|nr:MULTISPECIES: ethanolamine ammonia-lyase subunit EutC [unclassified Cupriavidus]MBP0623612.1 ethanolamine ammonia-lyase subunit EutC [Cupriavidus sp. LEh25]MDK2660315.1 ethanolamine ammonia-lyase subunit EutC [Cupriavidus sp. LEh21]
MSDLPSPPADPAAVHDADPWQRLRRFTRARIALGRTGHSQTTDAVLAFGLAHAQARDAVHLPLDADAVAGALRQAGLGHVLVHSAAPDRIYYLRRPDLGRGLDDESRARLAAARPQQAPDVVFVIADGLSALAAQTHAVAVLEATRQRLPQEWRIGPVVVAEQSRVALGDDIGAVLGARQVVMLIGERPGLSSPDSLGIYLTYAPQPGRTDAERNCISNVRPEGLSYAQAAQRLVFLLRGAVALGRSGVDLKDDSEHALAGEAPPAAALPDLE